MLDFDATYVKEAKTHLHTDFDVVKIKYSISIGENLSNRVADVLKVTNST